MYSTVYHGTISYGPRIVHRTKNVWGTHPWYNRILYYTHTHTHTHITHTKIACHKNSLKEGEEVDELSLGDAEREDGLYLLCTALLFSLGARNEGLSRTKLEDVPQVVL